MLAPFKTVRDACSAASVLKGARWPPQVSRTLPRDRVPSRPIAKARSPLLQTVSLTEHREVNQEVVTATSVGSFQPCVAKSGSYERWPQKTADRLRRFLIGRTVTPLVHI